MWHRMHSHIPHPPYSHYPCTWSWDTTEYSITIQAKACGKIGVGIKFGKWETCLSMGTYVWWQSDCAFHEWTAGEFYCNTSKRRPVSNPGHWLRAAVPFFPSNTYFEICILKLPYLTRTYNCILDVGTTKLQLCFWHIDNGNLFHNGVHETVGPPRKYDGNFLGCGI